MVHQLGMKVREVGQGQLEHDVLVAIELTKLAFDLGYEAALVVPPYYFRRATDEGLFNWFRGVATGRPKYQAAMAHRLRADRDVRAYFEGETRTTPDFFRSRVRADLGPLWPALPADALEHDPYAYLAGELAAVA